MGKKLSGQWFVMVCILAVGSSLSLAGCAQQELAAKQFMPTPTGVATVRPRPTSPVAQPGQVLSLVVTPLPGEKVRVGDVTEVVEAELAASPVSQRYSIQNEYDGVYKLFVRDSESGQEIRLGNDEGSSLFGAMTDQYVIWKYICHTCGEKAVLKTGLYAHVLATGDEIVVTKPPGYHWDPKISGQWIVYLDISDSDKYFAKLRAHNLATGEDFPIGDTVPYNRPGDYYVINDHKVAWVEVEPSDTSPRWMIRVYDLATHSARTLNIPQVVSPVELSLYGDIVVWWDQFWRGYDLKQDAVFTIPVIPPGWENLPVQNVSRVTVKDDCLYWSFDLGGRTYNFTAPIIR